MIACNQPNYKLLNLFVIKISLIKMCHELINVVNNFFQSTSMHGYAYVSNSSSLPIKIIWGVITLGMTCLGFQLLAMNTNEYLRSRITTTIESTTTFLEVFFFFWRRTIIFLFSISIPECCISINKCLQQESNWSIKNQGSWHLRRQGTYKTTVRWVCYWKQC